MKSLLGLFALCVVTACTAGTAPSDLPDGVSFIEKVERTGDEIVIPYEKFVLDNGLTVILHEDRSDPLVHVDVTYHVGSAREEIGKSGFAHFFEHMMFQGSENVGDDQHFKIVNESGGILNGSTNIDRTNYYQTVPKNQLEKMLWLEADRMGFLLPAVTQEKFEIQRDTVKNERAQNYDNKPYGLQFERTVQALYPDGHPYSWMTIGYVEDLDRVDVDDLKAFFLRWYGPNNAVLTIGGDIDRAQTLEWVKKYFGPIPRGPAVEDMEKQPATLDADRFTSMEDNVNTPLLRITLPTVYFGHPDHDALDAFASLMTRGTSSLLYKSLQNTSKAASAVGSHTCGELSCVLTFSFLPAEGYSVYDMNKGFHETLKEFEENGVSDDDLAKIKNGATARALNQMQSVSGKVSYLTYMETMMDNPNDIEASLERINALTKDDIMRVYEKYVKDKPAVYVRIMPKGEGDTLQIADNWTFPGRNIPNVLPDTTSDLVAPVITDSFDRSVMPPAGPIPALQSLEHWTATLPNGIHVIGVESDEVPTTAMLLRMRAGLQHEPEEKLGVANLTAYIMNEATELSTAEELNTRLATLSSNIRFYTDGEYAFMTASGLTRNFEETLEIGAERLLKPKFAPSDFDRWKKQALKLIELSDNNAAGIADGAVPLLLFGAENGFANPSLGRKETVEQVTLEDVRTFYEQHYSPSIGEILVISDMSREEVLDKLGVLSGWEASEVPEPQAIKPFPVIQGGTIYLIDKADAEQSEIRVVSRSFVYDALGDHYRLNLLNHPLAGSFNSRINLNLREDKGYSYGAFAFVRANEFSGRYVIRTSVRKDATAASIEEIFKELRGVVEEGITEEELHFTRQAIGQKDALSYETPNHKIHIIQLIQRYGLDPDWPKQQHDVLMNVTIEELNALAKKHLQDDNMITVVVGDKEEILEDIQGLGRPIIELDKTGRPL